MAMSWRALLPVLWTEGLWIALVGGLLLWEETGSVVPSWRPLPIAIAGLAVTVGGLAVSYAANLQLIARGSGWPSLLAGPPPSEAARDRRADRKRATPRIPHRLVTSGPYARLRNPQALGMLLALLGVAVAVDSAAIWLLPAIAVAYLLVVVLPVERRRLEEIFGEEYDRYREAVPAFLPIDGSD